VEYVGPAPLEGSDDRLLVATLRTGEPAPPPSLLRVASARAFVPQIPGRAIHGEVPMPQGRPYELGNSSADMASINATSEMSSSSRARSRGRELENQRAVSYDDDGQYIPADSRGPSELLAGRGLY
jgi:rare lipoprotein A